MKLHTTKRGYVHPRIDMNNWIPIIIGIDRNNISFQNNRMGSSIQFGEWYEMKFKL